MAARGRGGGVWTESSRWRAGGKGTRPRPAKSPEWGWKPACALAFGSEPSAQQGHHLLRRARAGAEFLRLHFRYRFPRLPFRLLLTLFQGPKTRLFLGQFSLCPSVAGSCA